MSDEHGENDEIEAMTKRSEEVLRRLEERGAIRSEEEVLFAFHSKLNAQYAEHLGEQQERICERSDVTAFDRVRQQAWDMYASAAMKITPPGTAVAPFARQMADEMMVERDKRFPPR